MKKIETNRHKPTIEDRKETKEVETGEIHNSSIEALRQPIEKILIQLKDNLDRGDYQLIIGDDASGRIPTLIFNTVIRHVYKEHRYPIPETRFLAGSRGLDYYMEAAIKRKKEEDLDLYVKTLLQKHNPDELKKALIVTDTISSGGSLKPLADVLKKNGLGFDFAAVGFLTSIDDQEKRLKYIKEKEKYLGGNIFYGQTGVPTIYRQSGISGVKKNPKYLFSEPAKNETTNEEEANEAQNNINTARADAATVSEQIITWYDDLSKKNMIGTSYF